MLPRLVVVAGRPGSGKSTLAKLLSKRLHWHVFSRDELKEGYLDGLESKPPEGDIARYVNQQFFGIVDRVLHGPKGLIIEAAFQHHVWEPNLARYRARRELRIVVCDTPADLAWQRIEQRMRLDLGWVERHPFPAGMDRPPTEYRPPDLNVPTLTVDTTNGYVPSLDEIVAFVSA